MQFASFIISNNPNPINPPIIGPTRATIAYFQSEGPLFLIGKIKCMNLGPMSLAGLIQYPVGPPKLKPIENTKAPKYSGII